MDGPALSLLKKLGARGLTLGSVESVTGGLFASKICDNPGASKVFKGSLVAYNNDLKTHLADVMPETIETYGVVSQEVADEMALGGARLLGVDICISFTGNAGPGVEPGTAKAGDVYVAVAYGERGLYHFPWSFKGSRNLIRQQAVDKALEELEALI